MNQPANLSFANGSNIVYLEGLYAQYSQDPNSVEASWRYFFEGYDFIAKGGKLGGTSEDSGEAKVEAFINAYRRLGHLSAYLNPLAPKPSLRENMEPAAHGLGDVDTTKVFHPVNLGLKNPNPTFKDIHEFLLRTYCGTIGADYREVNDIDSVVWFQEQMEACENRPLLSPDMKKRVLSKLVHADGFEKFLQDRFLGQKRFSIEGLDAMIVMLDILADEAAKSGAEEINIGMAHRGRLNVLANFIGKPYESIIKEFEGTEFNPHAIEGDVKYHKGFANEIDTASGAKIRVYLSPNPSHLEAVNPVLEGFSRSRQRLLKDEERKRVIPVLVHGDAAFVGQGIVAETLNFSELKSYTTGGTIHIVANNQVGFTANPDETRSCDYASDVAKFIRAPVLHVNADDPEAVVWSAILAVAYRQKYRRDFVIDLIGYRRHGHNETDEPGFTQPLMYKAIKDHPTVLQIYRQRLEQEGAIPAGYTDQIQKEFRASMQERLETVRAGKYKAVDKTPPALAPSLSYIKSEIGDLLKPVSTTVAKSRLIDVATRIVNIPTAFTPHPKIAKLYESRKEMLTGEGSIDWGMAELLAFGTVAAEGIHVRLSGQDCGRGTFSHRHAMLRDFNSNESFNVLSQVDPKQASVDIVNSPLSEVGCMGFEFGYSVADAKALVLWEAQFGDFVNGAQIIIDQFLVASEAKWKQTASLVLLLPHGYEGQGPEHSSARPERFLQSCGSDNIQVANVTTPAQFFHLLRRQVTRSILKPLIVMTPKSLLRHPKVVSPVKSFTDGGFAEIIPHQTPIDVKKVKRVVVCSGKIYFDLLAHQETGVGAEIPLLRIEQLYPFAVEQFKKLISEYKSLSEIVWTQEEPQNMGAWTYIRPQLEQIAGSAMKVRYVGRPGSGSTAEGSPKSHALEQQRIVSESLS
jgi:2-oxoglutarate dehydrogenase E1 component